MNSHGNSLKVMYTPRGTRSLTALLGAVIALLSVPAFVDAGDLNRLAAGAVDPTPVSGGQELLENQVNRVIWSRGT